MKLKTPQLAANNSYFEFNAQTQRAVLDEMTQIKNKLWCEIERGSACTHLHADYNDICWRFVAQVRIVCEFKNQQQG
ncbi:MAG: hypothetical protein V3V61_00225 [Gammaproteobacteria bacterium]